MKNKALKQNSNISNSTIHINNINKNININNIDNNKRFIHHRIIIEQNTG